MSLAADNVPHGTAVNTVGPYALLTPREREVVELICEGMSEKEIADRLGMAVKTVGKHKERIAKKTETHKITALVRWAIRTGLVNA